MNNFHRYNALVTRVVDGDTIDTIVYLGFNIKIDVRFRLTGYDAPETYRPKSKKEKERGFAATDYLKEMIEGKMVEIESSRFGKYRWLGEVFINDKSINQMMIDKGHIKKPQQTQN